MIAEISIFPVGKDVHLSKHVAKVIKVIAESGLPYKVTAMGTIVEGGTDEVFALLKACHEEIAASCKRVVTHVKIDDFAGRKGRIEGKVKSVEKRLGKRLKKT